MKRLLQFATLLALTFVMGAGSTFHTSTVRAAASFTVSTNQLIFSAPNNTNSVARSVTVTNTTAGSITVNATKSGADATLYTITGGASLNLNAGGSGVVTVVFRPTANGVWVAAVDLTVGPELEKVALRGLGFTNASGGNNEPSFQRVLDTFNFAIESGDNNPANTNMHDSAGGSAPLLGDEIEAQTFQKVGAGVVQVEILGNFLQDKTPDAGSLGWYPAGQPNTRNEIAKINAKSGSPTNNNHQTLLPITTPAGPLSFDPGTGAFGMYARYTKFVSNSTDRFATSEDQFNTWDDIAERHKMRVYPLRTANGTLVENAYLITTEDFNTAFDFNDIIFILRNVKPAGAGTVDTEPVMRLQSRDWLTFQKQGIPLTEYWHSMLMMSKVATSLGPGFKNKDFSTLRIFNDGGSQLVISSLTISNTNRFSLPNGETSITIPSGGFYDLRVRFIEPAGSVPGLKAVRKESLTLVSNAGTQVAPLVGGFQHSPENANELTAKQVITAMGFTNPDTTPNHMGSFKSIAGMAGESWYAAGEETLSKWWRAADPNKPVHVRLLATLQGCCNGPTSRLDFESGSDLQFIGGKFYVQSLIPPAGEFIDAAPSEGSIFNTADFEFVGPSNNRSCSGFENADQTKPGCGMVHGIRWWPARDANGWVIPGTFFLVQDYTGGGGGNYDYNDNLYMISNVIPVVSRMHPSLQGQGKLRTDLVLSGSAKPQNSRVNRDTTIKLIVRNNTAIPADNVNMTVNLPADVTLVNAPGCTGTTTLACNLGNFISGDIRFIDVVVRPTTIGDKTVTASVTTTTTEIFASSNNNVSVTFSVGAQTSPTAVDDSYELTQDTTLTVGKVLGVLGNDTDPNSDPLTAVLVSGPANAASFNLNPNGAFSYTPNAGYVGPDSFTYKANDGSDDSNVATVTITVKKFNFVPVANDDAYTINEDTTLTTTALTGILANDSDGNNDPLTISIIDPPTHAASFTMNPDGSFTYIPAENYFGLDVFRYRLNDGTDDSAIATVSITITAVPDVPVANDDTYDTPENTPLNVTAAFGVLANDRDGDNDPLQAILLTAPSNGTVDLRPLGGFDYTPNPGFKGQDSFTYTVTDNKDGTDTGTVTINVAPANRAPIVVSDTFSTFRDTPLVISGADGVLKNDSDPDGDPLTAELVSAPSGVALTLNPDGGLSYTPNAGYEGQFSFTYRASDNKGATAIGIATIRVNPPLSVPDDIVFNGGFEFKKPQSKNLPQGWTTLRLTKDGLRCNTAKKTLAYSGECAFRFVGKPGKNTILRQRPNVDDVEANDTLRISLFARGVEVVKEKAFIRVTVRYQNSGVKNSVKRLNLPNKSYPWTPFLDELTLKGPVNWVRVDLVYNGARGSVFIDNVSVRVLKPGTQYADLDDTGLRGGQTAPTPEVNGEAAGQGGAIPLPPAADLRGN